MSTSAQTTPAVSCDPETGLCTIPPLPEAKEKIEQKEGIEIIYVGDPMCSWCWGISPQLKELEYQAAAQGIPFRIVVGGLRPGGGDAWDDKFKDFLKHHWEEVTARSGQPFGYELFEQEEFNYDTEPSCRAVVAARQLAPAQEHHFYELVQYHFYVKNEDPGTDAFYQPICSELGMDYEEFLRCFHDDQTKAATQAEFQLNRQWGVRGYPTVLLRKDQELFLLATGYAEYEQMWESVVTQLELK
jgi:putative protein-disulfide isomerase